VQLRFLLDTHILIRWLIEHKRLSREQTRILDLAALRREQLAISAITLLEIVTLLEGRRVDAVLRDIFEILETNTAFQILPIDIAVATEVARLGPSLRDPADRAIVATARVHRLRLLTSDQRIIASKLVDTID
jgi:PIN domain nuclease of toxin-antitoxin system